MILWIKVGWGAQKKKKKKNVLEFLQIKIIYLTRWASEWETDSESEFVDSWHWIIFPILKVTTKF